MYRYLLRDNAINDLRKSTRLREGMSTHNEPYCLNTGMQIRDLSDVDLLTVNLIEVIIFHDLLSRNDFLLDIISLRNSFLVQQILYALFLH